MGGHHHDQPKIVIPDYRIYRVEDVPQLVRTQKKLAQQGLRDPWLRNEVWKYTEDFNKYTRWQRVSNTIFIGARIGFLAALITTGIEWAFFPIRTPPSYGDEHGGHH